MYSRKDAETSFSVFFNFYLLMKDWYCGKVWQQYNLSYSSSGLNY